MKVNNSQKLFLIIGCLAIFPLRKMKMNGNTSQKLKKKIFDKASSNENEDENK